MIGHRLTLDELSHWEAYFTIEDYKADYRAAVMAYMQTDGKQPVHDILTHFFPQYGVQQPRIAEPKPVNDDVYEWTWEDRKVFDRIIASLPKE